MAVQIKKITAHIIRLLYQNGDLDKARLASLRTTATLTSPRAQNVWPLLLENMETPELSQNGAVTPAERAVFTGLHLYAVAQQGRDSWAYGPSGKDQTGQSLFAGLNQLRQNGELREALDRRVSALLGMTTINGVVDGLNHLVAQLKGSKLALQIDYAQLAQDLYRFQQSYEAASRVRLQWGRAYYRMNQKTPKNERKDE